ncbi:MAG: hypothetical protein MJE66_10645 [Proteobacteria bacterium]|nr:hypothetical protein [Pseudomonadota bacterium]
MRLWWMLGALAWLALVPGAGAAPMDLADPRARTVWVEFEVSPPDRPAQRDTTYSRRFPAQVERGEHPGELRIRIDGGVVEEHLLVAENPLPGSFSDFVWVLDVETGHVVSARVQGRIERELDFGIRSVRVDADISIEMTTRESVGFRHPRHYLGQLVHRVCREGPRCQIVEPKPYDPTRGYVNAVGAIEARSGPFSTLSYSPLGEVRFSEVEPLASLPAVGAAPPRSATQAVYVEPSLSSVSW